MLDDIVFGDDDLHNAALDDVVRSDAVLGGVVLGDAGLGLGEGGPVVEG